jgi:hypothetical protein
MKGYMIRGQASGILTDRVFLRPPTEDEIDEALANELVRHGFDKEGKPRERWVMIIEVDIIDGDRTSPAPLAVNERKKGILTEEQVTEMLKNRPEPGTAVSAAPEIVVRGTGRVINPGDPGYAEAKAQGKKK